MKTKTYKKEAAKIQRRADAETRNEIWSKLSPSEKLSSLDMRLGDGLGAKKQRSALSKKA